MIRKKGFLSSSAMLLFSALALDTAAGRDIDGHKLVAGLSVYLGISPAFKLKDHPKDHPEAVMHGGPPCGRHVHHVMAAVFDAWTGERIEDAAVEARVSSIGLAEEARRLEPMTVADTITYGNYFTLRDDGVYRIKIFILRTGSQSPAVLDFAYEHRSR